MATTSTSSLNLMRSINDVSHMTGLGLESNIKTSKTENLFYYHNGLETSNERTPILVLIHGYPQTNFMWRNIIPLLPKNIPLFIPDIPGYGRSSPLFQAHNKRATGLAILKCLRSIISHNKTVSLILAGHDRGARIIHRICVDFNLCSDLSFNILGSVLLDIVPTLMQWESFNSASAAAGSFHWPFLANVELATSMIKAQGGDVWCKTLIYRWAGKTESSKMQIETSSAVEVYAESFKNESVIRASCDDYRAGAEEDVDLQKSDQKSGRKLDVDILVLFSEEYLGKRYDIKKVWQEWIGKGTLEVQGIGGGCGHFIAEEKPREAAEAIWRFWEQHAGRNLG